MLVNSNFFWNVICCEVFSLSAKENITPAGGHRAVCGSTSPSLRNRRLALFSARLRGSRSDKNQIPLTIARLKTLSKRGSVGHNDEDSVRTEGRDFEVSGGAV
jgi:hypothetical protein